MSIPAMQFPNYIFRLVPTTKQLPKNKVVFRVPLNLNKIMIKNYLEEIYQVKVSSVNTAIFQGRRSRSLYQTINKRKDYKKAIVTLSEPSEFVYPSMEEQIEMNQQWKSSVKK